MTETGPEKDHTAIEAKIRAALHSEPRLGPSFHLKQSIFEDDSSLVLDGEVPNVAAKKLALKRAAAIPGITGIVDRLHVIPATPMGDGEIRVHVRDALINELAFENLEVRKFDAAIVRAGGAQENPRWTTPVPQPPGACP